MLGHATIQKQHDTRWAAQGTNSKRASFDLFKYLSIWFINDNHLPWKIHDESFDSRKSTGATLDCTHLNLRRWFHMSLRCRRHRWSLLERPVSMRLGHLSQEIFRRLPSIVWNVHACPCGNQEWNDFKLPGQDAEDQGGGTIMMIRQVGQFGGTQVVNCVQWLHEAPPCHSTHRDLQPLIDIARCIDQETDGVALSAEGQGHVQAKAQAHLRPRQDDTGVWFLDLIYTYGYNMP